MQYLSPFLPKEEAAMDMLVPLIRALRGHEFLHVIADRFSILTGAIPLQTI